MQKQNIPAMIIVLTIICLASACSLALLFMATKDKIAEQEKKTTEESLIKVLPNADPQGFEKIETTTKDGKPFVYFKAYNKPLSDEDKQLIGYAATGSARGYSSTIVVMVGVNAEFTMIRGLRVLHQQETAGLGSQCQAEIADKKLWKPFAKPGKPIAWVDQFADKSIHMLWTSEDRDEAEGETGATSEEYKRPEGSEEEVPEVDAITGATITTNAVLEAGQDAINTLHQVLLETDE